MYLLLSAVTGRVRLPRLLLFTVNTCTYSYQLSLAVSDSLDCCCLPSTRVPTPISYHWPCQTPSTVVVYRQHVYLLLSAVTGRVRLPRLLLFTVNTCTYSYQLSLAVSDSLHCCCLPSTRVPTPISYHWPCQTPSTVVVYRQHVYLLLSAVTGRVRLPRLLLFTVNTCTYSYQLSLAVSDSLHCCCLPSTRVPTPISCHWPCQTPSTVVVYRQHVYLLLSAVTGRVRLPRLLLFTVNTCTYSYQLSLAVSDILHCCCLPSTRVPTPISCHWPCQTPSTVVVYCQHVYLLLSAVTGRVRLHRLLLFIVNTCTYSYQLSLAVSDSLDCCCLPSTRVPTPISCHWPCQTPSTVVVYRQHVYLLLSAVTGRVRLHRLLLFTVNTCTYSYHLSLAVSDSIDCCCLSSTRVPTPISCHYRQHVYLLLSAVTGRVRLPALFTNVWYKSVNPSF